MKPSAQAGTRVNFKLGQVEQVILVAIEALTTMLGTKLCDPCWERQRFELTKPEESK
jgi:hypothetical protein